MERKRIIELAVETLEKQKAELAAQIEDLRAELKGAGYRAARKVKPVAVTAPMLAPVEKGTNSTSLHGYHSQDEHSIR